MRRFNNWITNLSRYIAIVSGVGLLAGVLFGFYEILSRYLFNSSHDWANLIVQYTCVTALLFGAVSVTWEEKHISIDFIIIHLKGAKRMILEIVLLCATALCFTALAISGQQITYRLYTLGSSPGGTLYIPLWIPHMFFVLSMALCAFMAAVRIITRVRSLFNLHKQGISK